MINASVIIPTFNRAIPLASAIQSIVQQDYPKSQYEIIIVDNGSKDHTKKNVETAILNNPNCNIKYVLEPEPGLLSGRHRGALEAKGDILIFVDDDIEAVKTWLKSIMKAFEDENTHLIGGPSFPKFEVEPPEWIYHFFKIHQDQFLCLPLSLSYRGDQKNEIDPRFVWGINYSIRKKTLFNLGGFNPGRMPKNLQCFQGDGEFGLCMKISAKNLKAIYSPEAAVYHNIFRKRLTVSYFKKWFYYQGVCDSYTQIRLNRGLTGNPVPTISEVDHQKLSSMTTYEQYKQIIYQQISNAYVEGFIFHREAVKKNNSLLKWILLENYFDYRLLQKNNIQSKKLNADVEVEKFPEHCLDLNNKQDLIQKIFPYQFLVEFDQTIRPFLNKDSGQVLFGDINHPHKKIISMCDSFFSIVFPPYRGKNLLEIGTGAGGFSYTAKMVGMDVISTDCKINNGKQEVAGQMAQKFLGLKVIEYKIVSDQLLLSELLKFKNGQGAD